MTQAAFLHAPICVSLFLLASSSSRKCILRVHVTTKKAAMKTGLLSRERTKLEPVSDPKAAATFVFSGRLPLILGDTFVVCDAGGVTTDLKFNTS